MQPSAHDIVRRIHVRRYEAALDRAWAMHWTHGTETPETCRALHRIAEHALAAFERLTGEPLSFEWTPQHAEMRAEYQSTLHSDPIDVYPDDTTEVTLNRPTHLHHCDLCDKPVRPADMRYVMQRRPSDPTEYVCIMAGCPGCFPNEPNAAQLNDYADSPQFAKDGYLWITF